MQMGTNVWNVTHNRRTMHLENQSFDPPTKTPFGTIHTLLVVTRCLGCNTFCCYTLPFNRQSSLPMCVYYVCIYTNIKLQLKYTTLLPGKYANWRIQMEELCWQLQILCVFPHKELKLFLSWDIIGNIKLCNLKSELKDNTSFQLAAFSVCSLSISCSAVINQ